MKILKIALTLIVSIWIFAIFTNGGYLEQEETHAKEAQRTYNFGDIQLTELYKYPDFGFYVFKADKKPETPRAAADLLENMMIGFNFGNAGQQTIYIYDYTPDLSSVINAPKSIPANMMFAAQKLKPIIETASYRDFNSTACILDKNTGSFDFYSAHTANNWQWQYSAGDSLNNCHKDLR